jgi:hypothetical protein
VAGVIRAAGERRRRGRGRRAGTVEEWGWWRAGRDEEGASRAAAPCRDHATVSGPASSSASSPVSRRTLRVLRCRRWGLRARGGVRDRAGRGGHRRLRIRSVNRSVISPAVRSASGPFRWSSARRPAPAAGWVRAAERLRERLHFGFHLTARRVRRLPRTPQARPAPRRRPRSASGRKRSQGAPTRRRSPQARARCAPAARRQRRRDQRQVGGRRISRRSSRLVAGSARSSRGARSRRRATVGSFVSSSRCAESSGQHHPAGEHGPPPASARPRPSCTRRRWRASAIVRATSDSLRVDGRRDLRVAQLSDLAEGEGETLGGRAG